MKDWEGSPREGGGFATPGPPLRMTRAWRERGQGKRGPLRPLPQFPRVFRPPEAPDPMGVEPEPTPGTMLGSPLPGDRISLNREAPLSI